MLRKMIYWYQGKPVKVQLLLAFGMYFIFWIGVVLVRHHWFERQSDSPLRLLGESVFMAFFITLFFEWKKVKLVFMKK